MIEIVKRIAKEAGKIHLQYFCQEFSQETKDDGSIVTQSDVEAEQYIRDQLGRNFPDDDVFGEESGGDVNWNSRVWVVDPLDGTSAFSKGCDKFCIIIGLCENGVPSLGVVYFPVSGDVYYAEKGKGAWKNTARIHVNKRDTWGDAEVFLSDLPRRALVPMIDGLPCLIHHDFGSVGNALCLIAEGRSDVYFCQNKRISKWDTCGTQVILKEAGGRISRLSGDSLDYKQEKSQWGQFIASNQGLYSPAAALMKEFLEHTTL